MAGAIRLAWQSQPRTKALELEKHLGLSYEGGVGLTWGEAAAIAQLPESLYWDAMHTLWAGGG